jgi:hypothetical protein
MFETTLIEFILALHELLLSAFQTTMRMTVDPSKAFTGHWVKLFGDDPWGLV